MSATPSHTALNQLAPSVNQTLETLIANVIGDVFLALSVCVYHHGDCVLESAWGWVDPDTRQFPVQPSTLFDLASVTKLFTSTAFLSLVSAGKTALDTRLIEIIPEFGAINPRPIDGGQDPHSKERLTVPDEWRDKTANPEQVTFRHLLTHTSGLAPWRDVYNEAGDPPTPPDQPDPIGRDQRWRRAVQALCRYNFVGQPDGIIRYSDLGLMLLGESAARLHGVPGQLDKVIQNRVLNPLGLSDVTFNPVRNGVDQNQTVPTEDDPTWRKRRAWGEVHDENACGVGGVAGHAGLFATAKSVALLGHAWLHNVTESLNIAPELAQMATQEQAATDGTRRGLGWAMKAAEDSAAGDKFSMRTYGHTGFTGTSLFIDPDSELIVACLTNRVYPGRWKLGIHEFRRAIHDLFAEGVAGL
jgi:CubicO group peptidase (beta-lactamase class C family)